MPEEVYRRDRNLVLILVGLASLAWLVTLTQWHLMTCGVCSGMSIACPMCMGTGKPLLVSLVSFLVMWSAMMAAMMLPSVTPMVLLFSRVAEHRKMNGETKWFFVGGYLAAWAFLGLLAFAIARMIQTGLVEYPLLERYSGRFASVTLVSAGLYQLSPLKHACLRKCRLPLDFLLEKWRDGNGGALSVGLSHGLYCIGCCWGLMIVMFAVGLMNLVWMIGLTFVMSAEKISRFGPWIGRSAGILLMIIGLFLIRPWPPLTSGGGSANPSPWQATRFNPP